MYKGVCLSILVLSLVAVAPARAEYVAYAVVDGKSKPLPENIDAIEAKELVQVKWGAYAGNQSRVGVMPVENKSRETSVRMIPNYAPLYGYYNTVQEVNVGGNGVPVDGIDAIVSDVLHQSGRFRVLERTKLKETLGEQDLGASGRVSQPSAAKIGKVLGAEYLVQAVVTAYEPDVQGNNFGLGGITGGLLGGIKINNKKSMVGMNFRLINATTSEVTFSKQVTAEISESGLGLGGIGWGSRGGVGAFFDTYSKTPIGQAVIAAVNKGVYELVKQIGTSPVTGSVVKADGNRIFINLGAGQVQSGDTLKLLSMGEALIDPETGLNLGGDDEEIGAVQVSEVKPKFSIATVVGNLKKPVKTGDKLVSNRRPEGLQFAPSWEKSSSSGNTSSDSDF